METPWVRRSAMSAVVSRLDRVPAVVLLGPRQVGKTTLALEIAKDRPSVYLDLESRSDLARLAEPEIYLEAHTDELVILDEVHRVPGLFTELRGLIDRGRRAGRRTGRFLLLGSASMDLLRQSAESLAGRASYLELRPFDILEVGTSVAERLWVRGGFPESFLASNDAESMAWRLDFLRTYLERDVPQFGPRIPAETLRRFWTMLAHQQGGLLNAAALARGLGITGKTVAAYIDLLVALLLVRRLQPWISNVGKRLVRSPRVYVRDSGLVHALLQVADRDALLAHPVVGPSFEGFVVETLLGAAPEGTTAGFYRTSAGAEIDLVLDVPSRGLFGIEVKRSLDPRPEKGFHVGCADLRVEHRLVVYPGAETFPLAHGTLAVGLMAACEIVRGRGPSD